MSGDGCPPWAASLLAAAFLAPLGASGEAPAMNPIEEILRGDERLAPIVADARGYRLQAVLGLIEEEEDGPRLVQHAFRADAEYFYPASAIKLCAAVAALERLSALREETGLAIDEATALVFHPLFEDEVLEEEDPSNRDGGRITVGHEIRKIFLVSDNVAFNWLYELVGPAALNRSMHRAGLASARIVHRLSEPRTVEENRRTPAIELVGDGFRHRLPERVDALDLAPIPVGGLDVGRAYLSGGGRIEGPMDFRYKNRMSLGDLQRALAKVVRPEVDAGGEGFRLGARQRGRMLAAMVQYPRQSENPVYDPEEYPDRWGKLLLPGLERVLAKERLRIYNKVGRAYGFSVENAYVMDAETGRAFFLAAAIYTNSNGVLNDDRYEYEEVADPFLADLGEAVARALWGR